MNEVSPFGPRISHLTGWEECLWRSLRGEKFGTHIFSWKASGSACHSKPPTRGLQNRKRKKRSLLRSRVSSRPGSNNSHGSASLRLLSVTYKVENLNYPERAKRKKLAFSLSRALSLEI